MFKLYVAAVLAGSVALGYHFDKIAEASNSVAGPVIEAALARYDAWADPRPAALACLADGGTIYTCPGVKAWVRRDGAARVALDMTMAQPGMEGNPFAALALPSITIALNDL